MTVIDEWMVQIGNGVSMQARRHYSRAPITEAIIDFRVALAEDFAIGRIADIHARIGEDFPIKQPFHRKIGTFTVDLHGPDAPFKVDTSTQHDGFWFKSRDNLRIFQVTSEGFTFNRLAPYQSWEEFRSEARNLWEIYKEVCVPICVTRVAIRYVNQINIPVDGQIELKDYLNTTPELPSNLAQRSLQTFFMQLQIPQHDLNCLLIINEAIAPQTNPNFITIILDLDLFREQIWDRDDEDIWQFLEQLHDRKNEVFEASITDRTRELIS
jgi:uncharacterized protein (TIGR04255 family)